MKKLDKKVLKLWYLRNLFIAVPVLVGYVLMMIFLPNELKLGVGLSCGLVTLIVLGLCAGWPLLAYHFYEYGYDELKISIHRGVIFRHKIVIPIRQIQDLHLYDGPFMQLLKLSGIIISTAGSNFTVSGISKLEAENMLEDLETKLESRLDVNE